MTLSAKEEDIAQTAQASITIKASSNGDSDYDDLTSSFTVTESENDTARFVLSDFHSSLTITEGGSHTYSVRLNSEPSADVTVTVSSNHSYITVDTDVNTPGNQNTLSFNSSNYGTAQDVTVTTAEDDGEYDSETATLSHSVSGASEYSGQSISNVAVTSRDDDAALFIDTDPNTDGKQTTLALAEGGSSATYEVWLSNQPTGNVTVNLTEAQKPATGNVQVTSSKRLTFNISNWNKKQTVTVQAYSDGDSINGTPTIGHDASGGGFNGVSNSVTVTERDSQAAIVIDAEADRSGNQTSVSVNENGSATYGVSLAAKPAANVTVTPSVSGDDSFSVAPASLTFTPDNYGTAQTLTVTAATDDTELANGSATVAHTAGSAGDAHSGYDGVPARNLTATEIDKTGEVEIRNAAADADITTLGVPEGGSATYKVKLNAPPTGSVTVRLALQPTSGDRDITASPTRLSFNASNWNQAKTVTVRAAEDDDYTIGSRTISHTASGGGFNVTHPVDLTASEVDDEASFEFTNADGDAIAGLTVPEGGSADYYVALSTPPASAVQVNLAATGAISVSPSLVIFTTANWDTAQKVTASAAEEAPAQPSATNRDNTVNEEETITHTAASGDAVYNGKTIALAATGQDNDPGIVIRNAADDAYVTELDVREGSSAAYTVKLNSPPLTGDVTVTITGKTTVPGNDTDITVDTDASTTGNQNTLTFTATNWNTARTVTVRAANDNSVRKCVPERVFTHTAAGGDFSLAPEALLTATELDNDSRHIVLCSVSGNSGVSSLVVPEGVGAGYSVRLNLRPSGNVTVSLSAASSGDADITVSPASLTFTTENWSVPQAASLWAAEDDDLVSGNRNVNHTASGHSPTTLLAVEQDNDTESARGYSLIAYDTTATTVLLQATVADSGGGHSTPTYYYSSYPDSSLGCTKASLFQVFGQLAPGTKYHFEINDSSLCEGADEARSSRVTTKQVTLASSGVTASGATLSVSGWTSAKDGLTRDGDWHYRADKGPDAAACSAGQTGNNAALTGLDSATAYTYTMYQGSDCATSIEVFPSFTTSGQAMTVTTGATTAALAIPGYTSTWYYKHDGVNCRSASGSATGYVTGLARNTEYLFKAYSNGGCSTEIASKRASTQNPALAVSRVRRTKATLTLSNWVLGSGAGKDGNWWYKHGNTGAACTPNDTTGLSGATANLTGLSPNNGYTYQAFSDSNCTAANLLATANRFTAGGAQQRGDRKSGEDFTLHADNANPYGIWSNGTTMWVLDQSDDHIYAYNMSDQSRDTSKEFSQTLLRTGNSDSNPRGIWSDGTTMWVADVTDDKLYAYKMSDRTRDTSKEFALADSTDAAQDNGSPRGILSDDTTMWVADIGDDKLYAYTLATGARDTAKELNTLVAAGNISPMHLWSDGVTIWVADWAADKVFAYTLATGVRDTGKEFAATTHSTNAQLTGLWSNGSTMWVADRPDTGADKLFAYSGPDTWLKGLRVTGVTANSATLELLNHSGAWWYKSATAGQTDCTQVSNGTSTVNLAGLTAGASYTFTAYSDSGCANVIAAAPSFTTLSPLSPGDRDSSKDLTINLRAVTDSQYSSTDQIWSDGITLWVSEFSQGHELLAYTLATGARDEPKDIEVSHHHSHFTSDGTTIWLIRNNAATLKVIAYTLDTGARDESKDITLAEVNRDGSGLATDGETLWVSDDGDDRLYAYNLSTGARDIGKEFDLHPDNGLAGGMWTDNAFIWVLDVWRDRAYAYNLADGSRVPGKDYYPLDSQHTWPSGIWSNGTTTWIANYHSDTVFAYAAYPLAKYLRATATATTAQLKLTRHTGNWYYKDAADTSAVCSAAPTAVQTGTTVNLTGLTAGTAYNYKAYSDGNCASEIAAAWPFTTSAPALTASSYGNTQATLTLSGWAIGTGAGQDGNWWYKADSGPHTACSAAQTAAAVHLSGLTAGTAYTYTAYSDGNCANAIDAAPAFTTHANAPALAAAVSSATSLQLNLSNYTGAWWYKYTLPASPAGVCTAASEATALATGLTKNTGYTFKAYRAGGCDSADVIATAAAKSTTTPDLRVSKIKSRTATLTLDGWDPAHEGPWRFKGTASPFNQSCYYGGATKDAESRISARAYKALTPGSSYTFRAYAGTSCTGTAIDSVTFSALPDPLRPGEFDDGKSYAIGDLKTGETDDHGHQLLITDADDIWSNGTTLWLHSRDLGKLAAFNLSTKARDLTRDISVGSIWTPVSFTSDGATVWVAQRNLNRLWAYSLASKVRTPGKDITLHPDNGDRSALWTDGTTMYVADDDGNKLYAYAVADGTRQQGKEIDFPGFGPIWSDGTTMWVGLEDSRNIVGYKAIPPTKRLEAGSITATAATLTLHWHTDAWWYERTAGSPADTTCHSVTAGTTTADLTGLTAGSYTYKAYDKTGCNSAYELTSVTFTAQDAQGAGASAQAQGATASAGLPVLRIDASGAAAWEYTLPTGATFVSTELRWVATAGLSAADWTGAQSRSFTGASVTGHSIAGLQSGVEYKAQVTVSVTVGGAAQSAASATLVFTLPAATAALPGNVATVMAVHNGGNVSALWTGASDATGYEARYSDDNGATWTSATAPSVGTAMTIANLSSGKSYVVGIRATNAAGKGSWTNSAQVSVGASLAAPPSPPPGGATAQTGPPPGGATAQTGGSTGLAAVLAAINRYFSGEGTLADVHAAMQTYFN